jgi:hypothetical protein
MNTNQTANIFTTLIQLALGALVSRGLITGSESESLGGALAALVVFFVSHNWHSSPPSQPGGSKPGGGVLMVLLAAGLLTATGCANLSSNTFTAEQAAAATSDAALRGYAVYFDRAVTNPAAFQRTLDGLVTERATVQAASVKLGASLELVENLRASYATNSAVKPQLQAAADALASQAVNLVSVINQFVNINTNQP